MKRNPSVFQHRQKKIYFSGPKYILSMVLCLLGFISYGNEYSDWSYNDIKYRYYRDADTAIVVGFEKSASRVNFSIWDNIHSLPVTAIGRTAFGDAGTKGYAPNITAISLGSNIRTIGDYAFQGSGIKNIPEMSATVTALGQGMFQYCECLESVKCPLYWQKIPDETFMGCTGLRHVELPRALQTIGAKAFSGCEKLDSIVFPKFLTRIEAEAFRGCSLKEISLPDNLTYLGQSAFAGNDFKTISIPNSITSLNLAFKGCGLLETIELSNSITEIEPYEFMDCSSLASITLPNSIIKIGSCAFYDCSSLASITLPNSVTEISKYTFKGCSSLASITLPNSITEIGGDAFKGCSSLSAITLPNSVKEISEYTFSGCSSLASLTLPPSISRIEEYAFFRCSSLTSIKLPDSLTEIGNGAFEGSALLSLTITASVEKLGINLVDDCNNLHNIDVDAESPYFTSLDGVVYNKEMTKLEICPNKTEVVIPEGVNEIKEYAFSTGRQLQSVTLPATLWQIGSNAFKNCHELSEIYCAATTPPQVNDAEDAFYSEIYKTAKLYVPEESLYEYYTTAPWSNFVNIEAGIEQAQVDGFNISVSEGVMTVQGKSGETLVEVYDMMGRLLARTTDATVKLPEGGIYIVKIGSKVTKVTV